MQQVEIDALVARLDRLEACEAIRDGLHRCAKAINRADAALLKSCYHPDATEVHWIYVGEPCEFADFILSELAPFRAVRHSLSNPIIEIDGDRAFVETQFWGLAILDMPDRGPDAYAEHHSFGRYLDIWERRNGEWRIAHRHITDDGGGRTALRTGQPTPDLHPDRSGQPAPHDPSYRGFAIADLCPAPGRTAGFSDAVRARAVAGDIS